MCRFSSPLLTLSLISTACFCGAFVSPTARSVVQSPSTDHATVKKLPLGCGFDNRVNIFNDVLLLSNRRSSTSIASKEDNEAEEGEDADTDIDANNAGTELRKKREPTAFDRFTYNIFKLFSYCLQFVGAFFFLGFILNLLGFGYTVDMEHGLKVDRIQNIRNEVQFEMEIEREERAELNGSASSKYIIAPRVPETENTVVSVGDQ
mmetsp:Transcript_21855/g.45778  ORF Transcript_21855/g.45778 Transcript_21855/m.45778 type:complete len:206 (+) Transcript_21855:86-703(+)